MKDKSKYSYPIRFDENGVEAIAEDHDGHVGSKVILPVDSRINLS